MFLELKLSTVRNIGRSLIVLFCYELTLRFANIDALKKPPNKSL